MAVPVTVAVAVARGRTPAAFPVPEPLVNRIGDGLDQRLDRADAERDPPIAGKPPPPSRCKSLFLQATATATAICIAL
jgi:hypothetical protein